jgi:hypothetical protein
MKGAITVDGNGIVQIVQSLGFPIACVVAMFAMWQREVKAHDEEMTKLRESLEQQSKATTDALNNNSTLLARILDKLGEDVT